MPYQNSPYFDTPFDQRKLWRYMSIDKFLTMLNKSMLYFPALSLFSDKREGTLSEKTKIEVYKTNLLNEENTPIKQDEAYHEMKDFVRDAEEFFTEQELNTYLNTQHSFQTLIELFSNHLMFCNSWFLKESESHSMWEGYGDKSSPTSVAIQTTIGDFIKSIEATSCQIHIGKVRYKDYVGKVRYKDYEEEEIEGYEGFSAIELNNPENVLKLFYAPILHKRNIYLEEKEVRAIISFETICEEYLDRIYTSDIPFYSDQLSRKDDPFLRQFDTNIMKTVPKNGIPIHIDIHTLLKRIVMSPNAKSYFSDSFQDLIGFYGIDPTIVHKSEI